MYLLCIAGISSLKSLQISQYQIQSSTIHILVPIKRPLSRENTSPAQKMMSFILQGQYPDWNETLLLSAPVLSSVLVQALTDLLPGTHQDQGHLRKDIIRSCVAKRPSLSHSEATILFLSDPWSVKRTPEKHRYLVMSNGL